MTAGNFDGRLLRLKIDGYTVACAKSCSLNITRDLLDASCKSSTGGAKEHITGQYGWSVDVSALMDFSSTIGVTDLGTAIINATQVAIDFTTGVSGDTHWTGNADPSDLSITADNGSVSEYSGTLQGTGELTQASV
jgi:predicted secreted protein